MLIDRMKYVVLLGLLGGLGLAGCGENNEEPASGAAPAAVDEAAGTAVEKTAAVAAAVAETVPVIATPPAAPKASADVRAKALGFARFLPADTQGYLGVFDAAGFVAEMRGSKVGRFLEDRAAQEGIDIDEVEAQQLPPDEVARADVRRGGGRCGRRGRLSDGLAGNDDAREPP
jgi:hypothetical protein